MAGQYIINVLEPKCWDDGGDPNATDAPEAFRKNTLMAQHISFLKDFFRAYKDFSDAHIDTIEIKMCIRDSIWDDYGKAAWYVYHPNSQDYQQLTDAVSDYLEVFQAQSQTTDPPWQQTM